MATYEAERLIAKWMNCPWDYIIHEMSFRDYMCGLATSLDAEERSRFWDYLLHGGKREDWQWSSPDKAGTQPVQPATPEEIQGAVLAWMGQAKVPAIKSSPDLIAERKGLQKVRRDETTGKIYDMQGNEIDAEGLVFVPSSRAA